jgi:CheY-like chemotaxis protein
VLAATVLVADDDTDILRFVEINLRLEGFQVVTARDGPEALAKAVAIRPDLVLLDVRMPGMDGYTLCARVRADARLAAVPVVIVTASYGAAEVEAARRAGRTTSWSSRFCPPRCSTWPRLCSASAGRQAHPTSRSRAPREWSGAILAPGGAAVASWTGWSSLWSFRRP